MSEKRLRDLLHQAVPEAPELDPEAIRRQAGRHQRHRAQAAGVAAVLLTGGVALTVTALDEDRGAERPPSNLVTEPSNPGEPGGPLSPYEAPPCPAQQPEVGRGDGALMDLDSVVAVRLCPDFDPRAAGIQPARTPDQRAEVEDADALVHDLTGFAAAVRRLPAALPEYCTTDEGPWTGQSFAFYRADGSRTDLPSAGCELVTIEDRTVPGGALRDLYLEALDRQRATADYTRPFDHELACDTAPRGGPIRPGRERLVAAVACDLPPGAESIPEDLQPVPLADAQLADLDRAWARPGEPVVRDSSGEHECVDVSEPPSYIVAATDRSDVVQLFASPCGFLVWHGWEGRAGATIPTTLAELGLE